MLNRTFKMTATALFVGLAVSACSSHHEDAKPVEKNITPAKPMVQGQGNHAEQAKSEAQRKAEAAEKAKAEAAQKAKEAEKAKMNAKNAAEKADAERKAKEAEKAKAEAAQKAKEAEAAKLKAEQELKAKKAEEAKLKAEQELKAKKAEEAKLKAEQELKAKKAEEAKLKAEEERKAKAAKEAEAKKQQVIEERAALEKNLHNEGKWRVLLPQGAGGFYDTQSGQNPKIINDIYQPYRGGYGREYNKYFKNDNGVLKSVRRATPDFDLSGYEINPNKIQHLQPNSDTADALDVLDVVFVNQKYSSYAVWDNSKEPKYINTPAGQGNLEFLQGGYAIVAKEDLRKGFEISVNKATYKGKVLDSEHYARIGRVGYYVTPEDYVSFKKKAVIPKDRYLGDLVLNADFQNQKVSGEIKSFDTKVMDNALLTETKIKSTNQGQLFFEGKVTSDSKLLPTKLDFNKNQGWYEGRFVGPDGEEVVGKGYFNNYEDKLRPNESDYRLKTGRDFIFGGTREGNYSYPAVEKK
ncbi:hypothetical protein A4G19_15145 [Pasteurellaceae bacterium Macca]|nr:hypothetical protein [Pasteurellaceae bacterium Macca]